MCISEPTWSVRMTCRHSFPLRVLFPTPLGRKFCLLSTKICTLGYKLNASLVDLRHTFVGIGGGAKCGIITNDTSRETPIAIGGIRTSFFPNLLGGFSSLTLRLGITMLPHVNYPLINDVGFTSSKASCL